MKRFLPLAAAAALWLPNIGHATPIVLSGEIRNIDGDNDGQANELLIQRIYFDVTAGTSIFFDSLVWESTGIDLNGDGEITGFDNFMGLLSVDGDSFLDANDDSGLTFDDGSVHQYDSTLSYTFATGGTYILTVGQLSYSAPEAMMGYSFFRPYVDYNAGTYNEPGLDHGDWRVTMTVMEGSVSNVVVAGQNVPDSGSTLAMLGLTLGGVIALQRRFSGRMLPRAV